MPGEGFKIAMMELDGGRIGIASLGLGVGFSAIDFAIGYVKEREAFGKPLSSFEAIQWMITDSYTELEAAQLLVLRAAHLKETRQPFTKEASMAKLFATETARNLGLVVGFAAGFPMEFAHAAFQPLTVRYGVLWMIEMVAGCILAALAAGWMYRDEPATG